MTTTSLFAELLIIGVMAATWLLLAVMSFAKPESRTDIWTLLSNEVLWVPVLAFCYVLGTAIDVLVDRPFFRYFEYRIRAAQVAAVLGIRPERKRTLVKKWILRVRERIRTRRWHVPADSTEEHDRAAIKKQIPHMWHRVRTVLWEMPTESAGREISGYMRHRIRIVRAGSVNSLLLGIAGFMYFIRQEQLDRRDAFLSLAVGIIVFGLCIHAWYTMTCAYNRSLFRYYQEKQNPGITLAEIRGLSEKQGTEDGTVVQDSHTEKRSS